MKASMNQFGQSPTKKQMLMVAGADTEDSENTISPFSKSTKIHNAESSGKKKHRSLLENIG